MSDLSVLVIAALLALAPTILYALAIWWLDRHEKEPLPLLAVAFVWGAAPAVILAIVLGVIAGLPLQQIIVAEEARDITEATLVAPIVEEAVKAIILVVLFFAYKREFDNVLDGVVYGAMVGLGFAMVENVLYFTSVAYENMPKGGAPDVGSMVGLWVFRSGLFGLNHSMFTAFTGAALGLARSLKKGWQRGLVPSLGLGTAMIFHAVHNGLASAVAVVSADETGSDLVLGACLGIFISDWGGVLLILGLAVASSVREGHIIRETLMEEVALGRLTPDEFETLISGRKRWSVRMTALFAFGLRRWRELGKFFDLATELAFRKHRANDGDLIHRNLYAQDIARLRYEIDHLKWKIVFGGS